jgi:hypothetical protein
VQVRVLDLRGTTLLFAPISGIPAGGLAYMTLGRAALVDIEASRKRLDPPPNAAAHRRSSREQPRHEGDSQRREPVAWLVVLGSARLVPRGLVWCRRDRVARPLISSPDGGPRRIAVAPG